MADSKVTRLGVRPKDTLELKPCGSFVPLGLTVKAIRHRLLAERQAKYADRVLPFKPKGGK